MRCRSFWKHPLLEFEDAITVSGEGSYLLPCRLLGMIPFKDIKVTPAEAGSVYVSGNTVGIYMETEGVLIIDTGEILCEGGTAREPAKNIVRPGDYIVAFNEQKVSNKKELMEDLEILDGEDVILDVIRNGEKIPVSLTPVKDAGGEYKLGIWVRDNTQGIGTLTFVDEKGRYGALGHGISDVDTGGASSYQQRGVISGGDPGYPERKERKSGSILSGLIRYEPGQIIGAVDTNRKMVFTVLFMTEEPEFR